MLMGGRSAEREVSMRTGEGVAAALESRGIDVVRIVWNDEAGLADQLRTSKVEVAFLALHGRGGEDGCVQGMLELMGIPYTGSGVLASALAMDKVKAKEMFRLHNVPTPPYYVATAADLDDLEEVHASFGFPVVVKPSREGSSVGVTKATNLAELAAAIELALSYDDHALVERFVQATEVHVGILDGRVLGAIEIVPKGGMYDYRAKYTAGATEYVCPPRLPSTRLRGVMNLAERAARALSCTGACRVDLLVTEGQNEVVLEVNTLPGMTPTSLLPKIAAAAGLEYPELCEIILDGARLHAGIGGHDASGRRTPRRSHVSVTPADPMEQIEETDEESAQRRVG